LGKKIFIIRPLTRTAYEVGGYCRKALTKLNYEVKIFDYHVERISGRIKLPVIKSLESSFAEKLLFKEISRFSPELILAIKVDRLIPETIAAAKKKFNIPWANYWIDDPLWIDISKTLSPFYDYFFTNDPECVPIHKEAGCPNVKFLTFACDPDVHRKINLSRDQICKYASDISFVGAMVPVRKEMLEAIADFDLKIWSDVSIQYTNEKLRITREPIPLSSGLYSKFTGESAWGEELVKVFNASKIVLNIHSQKGGGTNLRTFEATGCGAFMLTEKRSALADLFRIGEEIACFETADELRNLVEYFLGHAQEREAIARQGQKKAYKEHTYVHRVRDMLSCVKFG
jgi:spore maturation protein CgeB